jgi:hypothetical protein
MRENAQAWDDCTVAQSPYAKRVAMVSRIDWQPIHGTLDYCAPGFVAVYKYTVRGYACYWTFRDTVPVRARTMSRAVAVGGLPERVSDSMRP